MEMKEKIGKKKSINEEKELFIGSNPRGFAMDHTAKKETVFSTNKTDVSSNEVHHLLILECANIAFIVK